MQWQDFDFDGKLKIPVGFYLALIYLLRGFIIWVISLTYSDDRSLLLGLIYSDVSLFSLTILTGLPAVFTFALFSLKKHKDKNWYIALWGAQSKLLLITLLIDLTIQLYSLSFHITQVHWVQMLLFILGSYLAWYWLESKRLSRFFRNWLV